MQLCIIMLPAHFLVNFCRDSNNFAGIPLSNVHYDAFQSVVFDENKQGES